MFAVAASVVLFANLREVNRPLLLELAKLARETGARLGRDTGSRAVGAKVWTKRFPPGQVRLYYSRTIGATVTESTVLEFFGSDAKIPRFDLRTQLPFDVVSLFTKVEDIEVGDPEFDPYYLLRAADAAWLREYLSPEIRAALVGWRTLTFDRKTGPKRTSIQGSGQVLELRAEGHVVGGALRAFHDIGMALLEGLRLSEGRAPSEVADPDEESEVAVGIRSECLVCGESLTHGEVVCCASCETPHHAECWSYNARCAVYGCRTAEVRQPPRT